MQYHVIRRWTKVYLVIKRTNRREDSRFGQPAVSNLQGGGRDGWMALRQVSPLWKSDICIYPPVCSPSLPLPSPQGEIQLWIRDRFVVFSGLPTISFSLSVGGHSAAKSISYAKQWTDDKLGFRTIGDVNVSLCIDVVVASKRGGNDDPAEFRHLGIPYISEMFLLVPAF